MAEYIDREALIRYAEKQEVIIKDGTSIADAMSIQGNVFRRCVETCPAADVVEVVRCKDCKHAKMHIDIIGDPHLFCALSINRTEMEFDDYCSYGERKDNG